MNSTLFTPPFASGGGSGLSKEAIISAVGVVISVLLFICGYLLKWFSSCKSSKQLNSRPSADSSSEGGDLEMGHRATTPANTNYIDFDEQEIMSVAHNSDLSDPHRSDNLRKLDEQRSSSGVEHANLRHSHSRTSIDALSGSRDGRQTPSNSGHGNTIDTITSIEVDSRVLADPSRPPANSDIYNVNERHHDQANDAYRADFGDSNEALISFQPTLIEATATERHL
ncbi:uncharacterized protein BKA78DRAFT_304928 [Phyllosticta capitalensis]|uniref:uncharacterized protein n=1 Tax=Phyllosticta capitalensis TaxID=121624 RepID=UPI003130FEF5